jgi:hypothetical protein
LHLSILLKIERYWDNLLGNSKTLKTYSAVLIIVCCYKPVVTNLPLTDLGHLLPLRLTLDRI